jgi:hypothetical protein
MGVEVIPKGTQMLSDIDVVITILIRCSIEDKLNCPAIGGGTAFRSDDRFVLWHRHLSYHPSTVVFQQAKDMWQVNGK